MYRRLKHCSIKNNYFVSSQCTSNFQSIFLLVRLQNLLHRFSRFLGSPSLSAGSLRLKYSQFIVPALQVPYSPQKFLSSCHGWSQGSGDHVKGVVNTLEDFFVSCAFFRKRRKQTDTTHAYKVLSLYGETGASTIIPRRFLNYGNLRLNKSEKIMDSKVLGQSISISI